MSSVTAPSARPYGFYAINKDDHIEYKKQKKRINILNALAYIPLISLISGLVGCCLFAKDMKNCKKDGPLSKDLKQYFASAISKQIIGMIGLGLLLMLPDLIITSGRARIKHS